MKSRGFGAQQLGGRPLAVPLVAVAARALPLVHRLPGRRVPRLREHGHRAGKEPERDEDRDAAETHRHQCVPSQRRGCCPVASYRYMMTCQICSSRQSVLPGGHDRIPGRRLLRQPGPALGDAPEEVRLLEHRDRARILEVRRRRVEAVGEVALPVEVVAVAVHAVADVDLRARRDVLLEIRLILAQRVVQPGDLDLLAAKLDRSPAAPGGRRAIPAAPAAWPRPACRRSSRAGAAGRPGARAARSAGRGSTSVARIGRDELAPRVGVGRHEDQHGQEHDRHVEREDAPRRRRSDAERGRRRTRRPARGRPGRSASAESSSRHLSVSRNATRSTYSFAVSDWPNIGGMTPFGKPATVPDPAGSRIFFMM